MSNCQKFQIAIEKQLHGALGEEEVVQLEKHFAFCKNCQNFADTSKELQEMMHISSTTTFKEINYKEIREKLDKNLIQHSKSLLLVSVFMLFGIILYSLGFFGKTITSEFLPLVILPGTALTGAFIGVLQYLNKLKEEAQLENTPEELHTVYQKSLDKRIQLSNFSRLFGPAFGLFINLAVLVWQLGTGFPEPLKINPFYILVGLFSIGAGIYIHFFQLPRLLRERKEFN